MVDKKNLRMYWITTNSFLYVMFIGASGFVLLNLEGIIEIGMDTYWFTILFFLFLVCIFGSFRIRSWIKQGKL